MLTSDVIEIARKVSRDAGSEPFFDFLNSLSALAANIPLLLASLDQTAKQNLINSISSVSSNVSLWDLYASAENYKKNLLGVAEEFPEHWPTEIDIPSKIDAFLSSYENFIKHRRVDNAIQLLWIAHVLSAGLASFLASVGLFKNLLSLKEGSIKEEVLAVRLDCEVDFRTVEISLRSCEKSYELICQLLGLSKDEFPPRLIKVETGSFMAIFSGEGRVIAVLKSFWHGFVQYALISRRVADIQTGVKVIESQLALKAALEQHGIDTENIAADLAEAAEKLAKQTNNLIGRSESIGINGTFVSLRDEGLKLIGKERKLLSHDGAGE